MKHIGNLEITEANKKDFADLVEVTGNLYVYGSAKLEALQTVGGNLYVYGSAKLEALQTVGGDLRVYGPAKLEALQTVGGNLYVYGSAKLEAPLLQTVGGNLYVYGSAKLEAPLLQTVGGDLYVDGSAKLEAPLLQTVGGYLYVYGSAKLEALQTVGGNLYVDGSAKLEAPLLQTVGGYLRVYGSAKLEAPNLKEEKTPTHIIEQIKSSAKKTVHDDFERQGYLFADNILQTLISKKTIKGLTIYKTKHIVKDKKQFVVFDGVNYSHGDTLEQAKEDLKYKISSRDTTEFKSWKVTDVKPVEDLIKAYRSITGACAIGTKDFCESQELKEKYTIKEIFELTKGKYGNDQFVGFWSTL